MKLTEINIYPIKSMGCLSLREAEVLPAGLRYDRRWLLLDGEGKFLTQRNLPEMAKMRFVWKENGFEASFPEGNNGTIYIPFDMPDTPPMPVQVWHDTVEAHAMPAEVSEWFGSVFQQQCKLVRIGENSVRKNSKGEPDKISSFADITPFLIIGEASLHDLNARLVAPVPMSRFRPNFVFSSGAPYEEDDWAGFVIGDVFFKIYKKCGRCKVTTIDQTTGLSMGEEPLATLGTYRKEDGKLNFGVRAFLADGQGAATVSLQQEVVAI